jgi:tetratricopeptide (TPR) repeat protein
MAVFNALSYHGMSYVIDPRTPYDEFSENATAVDYIEFPRRTLEDGAGDCDDLSILYASLLESIGVGTAFITVPGHIFAAVDLGVQPAEARRTFTSPEDLIYDGDRTWLPVEVTAVGDSFLEAWSVAARQWRRFVADEAAAIYPMDASWQHYDPVNLPTSDVRVSIDDPQALQDIHREDVDRWIVQELRPLEQELLARLKRSDSPATRTRLGVVYARYGRLDDAKEQFTQAVSGRPYLPALLNLATVYYLEHDYQQAAEYYEKVLQSDPENPSAVLGMARVGYETEDYDAAEEHYSKLAELDPDLAERFSYLDLRSSSSGRAADSDAQHNAVVWEVPE